MIEAALLECLADPLDPEQGTFRVQGDYLVSDTTGRAYPVVEGLPRLLPENAIPRERWKELDDAGWRL